MPTPRAVRQKWCVSLSSDGWGFWLHPYRGEEDHGPDTDIFDSFQQAKRECLRSYRTHLKEVKDAIAEIRHKKLPAASEGSK